jgi:hypothetical protein
MIDLEYDFEDRALNIIEIGLWLDSNMPNPPLPEPQRWTIGYSTDGRVGVRFAEDRDATVFCLRWGRH